MKTTTRTIRNLKGQRSIVALTAYDTVTATLAARAGVDIILVGDSVGTTLLGFETTIPVTLEMMVHHTAAVARAGGEALLVADLPFPEGHRSYDLLLDACSCLMKKGCAEAVKIEGGSRIAPQVARLVDAGIPVLGHIGLLPQRYHAMGGYRKFGKNGEEKKQLMKDAKALQEAGTFAIIGELMPPELSAEISGALEIPFIGIGSGPDCDGQILVSTDLIGLNLGKAPSFVKVYANLADEMEKAFKRYVEEVRGGKFP